MAAVTFNGQGMALFAAGTGYGPRTLDDYEFLWLAEGTADYVLDGRRFVVPEDGVVLVRPGQCHQYRFPARARHGYVHFTCDPSTLDLPAPSRWPSLQVTGSNEVLPAVLRHLLRLTVDRPAGWKPVAASAVQHALLVFVTGASSAEADVACSLPEPVERALGWLAWRWSALVREVPSLVELAAAAGVGPEHLIRLFRRSLNQTPMSALRRLRLDRAAGFLERSDMTAQHIARECGFPNPDHFSRAFRKEYGVPPAEFRRRIQAGIDRQVRSASLRRMAVRVWDGSGNGKAKR